MNETIDGYWHATNLPDAKGDCLLEVFKNDRKISETSCRYERVPDAFDRIVDTHRAFGRSQ